MKLSNVAIALLMLFPETKPVAKLAKFVSDSEEIDAQLRDLPTGERTTVEIPDELDIKFRSKTGKRFALDAGVMKRLD